MKNLNKKGFTLIELLAVIVVLAIIMVLAVPNVLNTMNTAKQNSFKLYAEKVYSSAQAYVQEQSMIGQTVVELAGSGHCYTLAQIKLTNTGNYKGSVLVTGTASGTLTYEVYLWDGDYSYSKRDLSADASLPETTKDATADNYTLCGGTGTAYDPNN